MSNPYIGPRPFTDTEEHQARFFGRKAERDDLGQQLRSDRILVLHSPSGAGKTSLLQAGLIPQLRTEMHRRGRGINIINPIRVGLPPTADNGCNRWVHSVLRTIEECVLRAEGRRLTPEMEEQLVGMDLHHYCMHRSGIRLAEQPTLLVIDQFEEIFTRTRHAHGERVELFTQLAKVLSDPSFWAVIALREEYVAALDAYKRLLPTQLASRFHLDFLTSREARECIVGPASEVAGVDFTDAAVKALIDDLAGVDDGESSLVDPLHLQLVCYELWQMLAPERGTTISAHAVRDAFADRADGRPVGDELSPVERALFSYYQEAVSSAANPPESSLGASERGSRERQLRDFIERHLIEDERYRRQALIPEERADLAEGAERLVDAHVLRAAVRPYQTWYEISHDRLVEPIRLGNRRWFDGVLGEVEKQARRWCQHRPAEFTPPAAAVLDRYERDRRNGVLSIGSPEEQRYARWTRKGLILVGFVLVGLLGVVWQIDQALDRESIESDLSALVSQSPRLTAQAMTHRWRHGDHERALLLANLARWQGHCTVMDFGPFASVLAPRSNWKSATSSRALNTTWTPDPRASSCAKSTRRRPEQASST